MENANNYEKNCVLYSKSPATLTKMKIKEKLYPTALFMLKNFLFTLEVLEKNINILIKLQFAL